MVPPSLAGVHALLLGHQLVEQQQDGGGGVDGHRRGDLVEGQAGRAACACRRWSRWPRRPCPPRPRPAGGRSRSPSGWAGRRRRTGRSTRWPAAASSARWSPRPSRTRSTAAWSRAGPGTWSGRRPGCRDTGPGIAEPGLPGPSPSRSLGGVDRLDLDAGVGAALLAGHARQVTYPERRWTGSGKDPRHRRDAAARPAVMSPTACNPGRTHQPAPGRAARHRLRSGRGARGGGRRAPGRRTAPRCSACRWRPGRPRRRRRRRRDRSASATMPRVGRRRAGALPGIGVVVVSGVELADGRPREERQVVGRPVAKRSSRARSRRRQVHVEGDTAWLAWAAPCRTPRR